MSVNEMLMAAAGSAGPATFVEDVFSTYLYTGNGSTQTITNGIDLSGKGGLVWTKGRNFGDNHGLYDTARGATKYLMSNLTTSQSTRSDGLTAFLSTGYTLGADAATESTNASGHNYASWTFRKQAKFFDVVTYTGNGAAGRQITHNLGSTPGCIIVKTTTGGNGWNVWHRSLGSDSRELLLNSGDGFSSYGYFGGAPTSTTFTVDGAVGNGTNTSGETFIAYIFAHDASGFGTAGTDNVISCGSYTGNGSSTGPVVTLGYEPQWLLIKRISNSSNWNLIDNMRGFVVGGTDAELNPNVSDAESTGTFVTPTATGFQLTAADSGYNANTNTYIYIAIRRGPMKTPTSGTSVFVTDAAGANASANGEVFSSTFPVDFHFRKARSSVNGWFSNSRLIPGSSLRLESTSTESSLAYVDKYDRMSGIATTNGFDYTDWAGWLFKRAPGFFDIVCYTGTGSNGLIVSHNLGVVPELTIFKCRSDTRNWEINFDFTSTQCQRMQFTNTNSNPSDYGSSGISHYAKPTSTQLSLTGSTNAPNTNDSGQTYVGYLFATVTGVSKVGTYIGNGTSKTINCGFTAGARFVLIKQMSDDGGTSGWVVFDSARGINPGNDPHLSLNTTAAEITTNDAVDADNSGFIVNETTGPNINRNNQTYLFLAIA